MNRRVLRVVCGGAFVLGCLMAPLAASLAEEAKQVTKIVPDKIKLYNPETRKTAKSLLRVQLEGKKIDIKKTVAKGKAYLVTIPGDGDYLVRAKDVKTDVDEKFYEKCRTQTASASAATTGTGRGFGSACSK